MDEHRGTPYLAMQLLEGETLGARLKRDGKLPPGEVVAIARQIASGLAAAHQHGVVHRDIKPENIWLESTASGPRVKILDFGLARVADADVRLTQFGTIAGTPAYMSPEQAQGNPVDHRTDLFSLGCVLYEMCTGRAPFVAPGTMATLRAIERHHPPPPHKLVPDVPRPLSDLVMRLLAKDPARRVQSAREALDAVEHGMPSGRLAGRPPRRRFLVALATAGTPSPAAMTPPSGSGR